MPSAGAELTRRRRRWVRALRRSPVRVLPPPQEPAEEPRSPVGPPAVERSSAGPGLWYEKAEPGDGRLSFRDRHGKVLLEGLRLVRDALEAGAVPCSLFFSAAGLLRELPQARLKGASLVKVKFEEIKSWSDLVTPQGVIARCPWSSSADNIRDPGNLGTVLRSAAGAGSAVPSLFLPSVSGCVDPWEPKVLRAGMGAHFRIPIVANLDWESVPSNLPATVQVCVADHKDPGAQAEAEPVSQGAGRPGSASGNLKTPVKSKPGAAPPEHEDGEGMAGSCTPELTTRYYYESWIQAPAAVVVGGETHGLSLGALHLAASTGGKRLVIPMVPGVDSLNSAVAAAIMLFEGRRQLLQRNKQEDKRQKVPVGG
uniref:RNA 2-O ribose methyltransferase substrate binding domain-containing protein n=1 Tax=Anas platyrhynchos TaxID=8839 RepID=A0A8B9ZK86_ANAPL